MAQDSGSQNKAQEIDLDELEVVILILGKNAGTLNTAASFLTRRGWPTTVMTNMSKAVEYIAEKKPDFVLVSFSHTNPAVIKLPDLISQTFNLACVGFVESTDTASTSKLNNMKMRHKIQGMPSGPNLHRSIRKILAEKFNIKPEGEKNEATRERGDRDGNTVTVKGADKAGVDKNGNVVQSKGQGALQKATHMVKGSEDGADASGGGSTAVSSGRKRLSDLGTSGADGENADSRGGFVSGSGDGLSGSSAHGSGIGYMPSHGDADEEMDSVSTGKYTMSKKTRKSLKDFAPVNEEGHDGATGGGVAGALAAAASSAGVNGTGTTADNRGDATAGTDGKAGGNLADMLKKSLFGESGEDLTDIEEELSEAAAAKSANSGDRKGGSALADALAAAEKEAAEAFAKQSAKPTEPKVDPIAPLISPSADQVAAREAADAYYKNSRHKEPAPDLPSQLMELTPAQLAALPADKLMERAVASAMHRVCQRYPETITRELGKITKVAVFPIDSTQLAGYLVVGMEQNPNKIEDFFLKTVESALREEFAAVKIPATIENGFWVHVPEVLYHQWVREKGRFNVILPHEEGEVGVGFFPMTRALPRAEVSAENKDMLKIALDDIAVDQPVNFKAYLHLKKNQKYYLYLRNGRQLAASQKERLKGAQVENFFMKSVEAENLRMFLAASFLRETMKLKKAS